MKVAVLDFETYYDAEVSLKKLSYYHYLRHPKCEVYLLSIVTSDGFEWVGHPKDAPWDKISGDDWVWLHHNAAFEDAVFEFLKEIGVMPEWAKPAEAHCTADLSAYLGAPRSMDLACEELLGIKVDKGPRDRAKGKRWEQMTTAFQDEMKEYALKDGRYPLQLWTTYSHEWPQWER